MSYLSSSNVSNMSLTEKTAYAEMLEELLRIKLAKIAHYDHCVSIEFAATSALNQFQQHYTRAMITHDPLLQAEENRLIEAKTKAWNDRFAAESAAYPPTLESILWIVAKSGYTKEVAPMMNLSKATRECKNLQRVMREERNGWGKTQLRFYSARGMTASVMRMLEMKSIDVEAKLSDRASNEGGWTCLMTAVRRSHLAVCRLLIDKGAQMEARSSYGRTPLHYAAHKGQVEIVRLLCDRGADIEACDVDGWRPLALAARFGHISVVRVLIEERNAEINARDNSGRTALKMARTFSQKPDLTSYLILNGGIE